MTNDNKTQSKPEKRKCKKCGSTLRAIGKDRANGKPGRKGVFSDWSSRQYHKQCLYIDHVQRVGAELRLRHV